MNILNVQGSPQSIWLSERDEFTIIILRLDRYISVTYHQSPTYSMCVHIEQNIKEGKLVDVSRYFDQKFETFTSIHLSPTYIYYLGTENKSFDLKYQGVNHFDIGKYE